MAFFRCRFTRKFFERWIFNLLYLVWFHVLLSGNIFKQIWNICHSISELPETKSSLATEAIREQSKTNEAMRIATAKIAFKQKPLDEQLLYPWIPDPTRFEGVDELIKQFNYGMTDIEKYLYFGRPFFPNSTISSLTFYMVPPHPSHFSCYCQLSSQIWLSLCICKC